MKWFYIVFAILGTLLPYSQFMPWVAEHGLDASRFVAELFSTRIGATFGLDVFVSAFVVIAFIMYEGTARHMRLLWAPIAATFLVGVSCGLPLFLYLRELKKEVAPNKPQQEDGG